jgi:hypothetical protein
MANGAIIAKRSLDEWKRFCEQIQAASTIPFGDNATKQKARKDKALKDYNFFVRTYFPTLTDCDCADFQIKAANRISKHNNEIAVFEWPREHAKSMHSNVFMPMWLLSQGKLTGMVLMGKNETDASNLLSDLQAQLQFNELFAHDYGDQYNFGSWEEGDFTTKNGIRFVAIGRDQSPRGLRKNEKRPNLAVIDDIDDDEIVNNQKRVRKVVEKIFGALYFALQIKDWRMIVAGNRIHAQSILAHIVGDIKPGAPKREGVFHSKVFAIDKQTGQPAWKERYTLEQLQSKMKAAGTLMARREFFHENHVEGTVFKDQYIQWRKIPRHRDINPIIGYFDPSFENKPTSDFKAVRVWGLKGEEKYCLGSFVRRAELGDAFNWMSDFEDKLPPGTGIIWYVEKQFFNRPIQDALHLHNKRRKRLGMRTLAIITDARTKEEKFTRIVRMQPTYENGLVFFDIDQMHNPDMVEGNNQLKGIEPGYKSPDDAPDADEGAWYYLDMHLPDRTFSPRMGRHIHKRSW